VALSLRYSKRGEKRGVILYNSYIAREEKEKKEALPSMIFKSWGNITFSGYLRHKGQKKEKRVALPLSLLQRRKGKIGWAQETLRLSRDKTASELKLQGKKDSILSLSHGKRRGEGMEERDRLSMYL